jgi:hypothetical protein
LEGGLPRIAYGLPGSGPPADQAAAGLARLLTVVLRLRRCGSLETGGFGCGFLAGDVAEAVLWRT